MALNVQADLRKRLEDHLGGVEVKVNVPADRPEKLVTVLREGGRRANKLLDMAGIGINCYAPTEQEAWELANKVADIMEDLPFPGGYAKVEQESMYSDLDPSTNSPRWYLSYTLTTYQPNI